MPSTFLRIFPKCHNLEIRYPERGRKRMMRWMFDIRVHSDLEIRYPERGRKQAFRIIS